jgi:threonine/homoserine/homoserine lactone efflux protein
MQFIFEYWSLLVIMFLAMMSPGPDFILVLRNGRFGFKSGLATSLGITLGFTIHTCLVIFGFSYIIVQNPTLKEIVSFCGALYLFYLSTKIWKGSKENIDELSSNTKNHKKEIGESLKEGFLCNILNPKVLLFILSLFTQFLPQNLIIETKLKISLLLIFECMLIWSLFGLLLQLRPLKSMMFKWKSIIDKILSLSLFAFSSHIIFKVLLSFSKILF